MMRYDKIVLKKENKTSLLNKQCDMGEIKRIGSVNVMNWK